MHLARLIGAAYAQCSRLKRALLAQSGAISRIAIFGSRKGRRRIALPGTKFRCYFGISMNMPVIAFKRKTSAYGRLDSRRIARLHTFSEFRDFRHQLADQYGRESGYSVVIHTFPGRIEVEQDGLERWPVETQRTSLKSNGGYGTWFVCSDCHRRCAILYLRSGKLPSCRICVNLAYESQAETQRARKFRARNKLAFKMNWDMATTYQRDRPKGMWHRTYLRALLNLQALEASAFELFRLDSFEHGKPWRGSQ